MSAEQWRRPGPPGGIRQLCVYAWCGWFRDLPPRPTPDQQRHHEHVIRVHLDERHAGWNVAELEQRARVIEAARARAAQQGCTPAPTCWLCGWSLIWLRGSRLDLLWCPGCDAHGP